MEIEIGSENEIQLKRIRKPPLLLNQEESLVEQLKKCPWLFDKSQITYKERDAFQNIFLIQNLRFFSRFDCYCSKF